jgi:hypothetical protein
MSNMSEIQFVTFDEVEAWDQYASVSLKNAFYMAVNDKEFCNGSTKESNESGLSQSECLVLWAALHADQMLEQRRLRAVLLTEAEFGSSKKD